MKNKHSNQDEPDMISVFIGTWNMGSVPPQKNITSWMGSKGLGKTLDEMAVTIPHDIYVFGTQENSVGDKEWVDFLRVVLKECTEVDYRPVAMQSLWNIKIVVLVRLEHENRISHISTSSVKTGIANTLGNKGAVGISFMFNGTSFGFVNCHLTSGNEKTASRKEFEPLLKVDQLNLEKEKNKIFLRFSEEEITFPPTYRYERGSRDTYVWHKHKPTGVRTNVPSWCDRILWKSYPETHIICNSYGCTDDIMTSDHSPVFASFEVGVTSQFVSKKGLLKPSEQAYIEFESIEAIVKTASRTKFFIEFYSGCLEEYKKSSENDSQSIDNVNFLKVQWSSRQLPTLRPILSEIEYLQDQHLLLTVKSMDGYESYGECVIALKSMIGSTAQQFLTYLSHRGEETGNIRGSMKVRVPAERLGTRERLYEWISIDKDETGAVKGKPPSMSRPNHEYTKSTSRKPPPAEAPAPTLGKLFEEPEKGAAHATGRPPAALPATTKEDPALARCKMEAQAEGDGLGLKNSFNNPAYYVLEGVPHQLLPPDGQASAPSAAPKNKVQITVPAQRRPFQHSARSEEASSDEDGGTLNLPPPDFPPPPLPKAADFEMLDNPFYMTSSELHSKPSEEADQRKVRVGVTFSDPPETKYHPKTQGRPPIPTPQSSYMVETHTAHQDDRSCSVLQMARTLSEVDYSGSKAESQSRSAHLMSGKSKMELSPRSMDFSRPLVFPPHCIRESIQEDLAEEAAYQGGRNSLQGSSVGEWLRAIGLERYEEGLIHNGWDDLEFLSDIVEEDLEEAGVMDAAHKKTILDNLQLRK
ncbi:hypothetical protein GDO78_014513 [Eleutherodactylus coqui]|nr:hypothetical protein GDO78_014513 [Eleutherodactylus coqui]